MKLPSTVTRSPANKCITSPTMMSKTDISTDFPERMTFFVWSLCFLLCLLFCCSFCLLLCVESVVSKDALSGCEAFGGRGRGGIRLCTRFRLGIPKRSESGGALRGYLFKGDGAIQDVLVNAQAARSAGSKTLFQAGQPTKCVKCTVALGIEELGQLTGRESELVIARPEHIFGAGVRRKRISQVDMEVACDTSMRCWRLRLRHRLKAVACLGLKSEQRQGPLGRPGLPLLRCRCTNLGSILLVGLI